MGWSDITEAEQRATINSANWKSSLVAFQISGWRNSYQYVEALQQSRTIKYISSQNNWDSPEPRGCIKTLMVTKTISQAIRKDCKENHKSLFLAWVDYMTVFHIAG